MGRREAPALVCREDEDEADEEHEEEDADDAPDQAGATIGAADCEVGTLGPWEGCGCTSID